MDNKHDDRKRRIKEWSYAFLIIGGAAVLSIGYQIYQEEKKREQEQARWVLEHEGNIDKASIIKELKEMLSSKMNAPNSVEFQNVRFYPEMIPDHGVIRLPQQVAICGEVNQNGDKNVGPFRPFISTASVINSDGVVKLNRTDLYLTVLKPDEIQHQDYFVGVEADVCNNNPKPPRSVLKSSPSKEMQNATLSEDELTSCFIAGESAATVYLSDVVKYSSSGLMPSTVMAKACESKGTTTLNPKSCVEQCELGFRKVARDALK